jgi:signal transduction histidine kinase/ActR/RegA family two-component response regulator
MRNSPLPLVPDKNLNALQGLVVDLIHRLLSATLDRIDDAIDDALARLGRFGGRDRAYVFTIRDGFGFNTHEWCAPGIDPMIAHLQNLPVEMLGGFHIPLAAGQVVNLSDIRVLDGDSAEYELLNQQGIRSALLVPMRDGEELFGMVGFDSVAEVGFFTDSEIYLLRAFADVVRSVVQRRMAMDETRKVQSELARERAFLEGIVSTAAAGFVVLSAEGNIIWCNDMAETVMGVPRDFMMGEAHNSAKWRISVLDETELGPGVTPFTHVQKTGQVVQNHRLALHCPDGLRFASINAAPIPAQDGQDGRVLYAVTDVTAQVAAERARETALEDARRASVAKSEFLARMSHEMRTPLNGVIGLADILSDSLPQGEDQRMLQVLRDSGQMLLGIINDLLDMAKIEADALQLDPIPFALSDLAARIEAVHTLRAAAKGLTLRVDVAESGPVLRLGDPQRIGQILNNTIGNAIKFTEDGEVAVTIAASDSDLVRITVADTGIGMTAEQLDRIFEPFSQAESSTSRRFGGTGLGMSIVRRLVTMMQGQVRIDSIEGRGTNVVIDLHLPATPITIPIVEAPSKGPAVPDRLRILAADDNRTNQMILNLMLGKFGADVTLCDNGLAALELYRAGVFDLLILDISMPGMDGLEVLRTIRAQDSAQGRGSCPAIAFTANAMAHQVAEYLEAGFDGCLTKPLTQAQLAKVLAQVMTAPPGLGGDQVQQEE